MCVSDDLIKLIVLLYLLRSDQIITQLWRSNKLLSPHTAAWPGLGSRAPVSGRLGREQYTVHGVNTELEIYLTTAPHTSYLPSQRCELLREWELWRYLNIQRNREEIKRLLDRIISSDQN